MLTAALTIPFYVLGLIILMRAAQGRFLSQFSLFYSYTVFLLISGTAVTAVYIWAPAYHPTIFWLRFLTSILAEFAVLVEISDHTFSPYPAIRQLGRFLTILICVIFFSFYILPSLSVPRPSNLAILDLVRRVSLTEAAIVVALLSSARYYRLPLGRNISGLMLGFSMYLGIYFVNFSLREMFGPAIYGRTFTIVGPLGSTLAWLVWTISLWRYEPVLASGGEVRGGDEASGEYLNGQLTRFNTELTRLLRK